MRPQLFRRLLSRALAMVLVAVALSPSTLAGVFVSVAIAPPILPVYTQPICPGPDYIWTPGYWAYGADGYFWVPGTWVVSPAPGLLWTPGYWGLGGGIYAWHAGYWGPHIGFYGGVNYGFGYVGTGFVGGAWVGGHFSYNTAVMNVNTTVVHNTYVNQTVVNNTTVVNRNSFNGVGGVTAQPTASEQAFSREQHVAPTAIQTSHENAAGQDRSNFASVNHGHPTTMAMARPMTGAANRLSPTQASPHNGNASSGSSNRGGTPPHPNTVNARKAPPKLNGNQHGSEEHR